MFDRIRLQLTAAYVGILALILIVFGIVVVVVFADQVADRQDALLSRRAQSKVASLLEGRVDAFAPAPGEPYAVFAPVEEGRVLDPPALAFRAPAETPSVLPAEPVEPAHKLELLSTKLAQQAIREKSSLVSTVNTREGDIRVFTLPVEVEAGTVVAVVQVGEPREVVRGTITRLILVLIPIGLGALILAGAGGLFMARRAMRPVQDAFDRQRAFIADASHELKTPLTLMRADAEVLSRSPALADDRELAEDLVAETDRMNAVLSDLLLLARLDTEQIAFDHKPFDLGAIIAATARRFKPRAEAEGISLTVKTSDSLEAQGDPARTGQILAALLDNAFQFTPSGGHIDIIGSSIDHRVEAIVRDSGPGIAPEHLHHIFDRFYRAEAARTREGGGTGLGLAIARDLARAQGGELAAENAVDGGAIFRLRLPRDRAG